MPNRCSCANAFIAASRTRIWRNDLRIARRANSTSTNTSGSVANVISDSWTSIVSMTTTIAIALTTSAISVIAPCANISLRLSMSFVMRVIRRPTGMRSKNAARCAST